MSFRVERVPHFVTDDAALMIAELLADQATAIRHSNYDEAAYAQAYAEFFGFLAAPTEPSYDDFVNFVRLPPREIAARIDGLIRQVGLFILRDADFALAHLMRQATWRAVLPPVLVARSGPTYTPSRAQQLENRNAIETRTHRAAALTFAERLPSLSWDSSRQADNLRRDLATIFDPVITEAARRNDGALRPLRQVYALCLQLINRRALNTREDAIMVLGTELPSLAIAHWAYREAKQVLRIRDANPTAHPNFMPPQLAVPAWPVIRGA